MSDKTENLKPEKEQFFMEEGVVCAMEGCDGVIEFSEVENCSCHISAPCSGCMGTKFVCPKCGWEEDI